MAAAALDLRKWHWPREPTKATWIQRLLLLVIVLICGFILNKVLVFSVLFIFLWKAWAQEEAKCICLTQSSCSSNLRLHGSCGCRNFLKDPSTLQWKAS
ncbi:uncharacterized protein LOC118001113 isoform X1 [Mirounga leonina]|uniref:uncharacterized protein LOC118001113 isoform X1 n=1 Tax=Mirounga leonina TaxID=9715 RepID=UPI00156C243E|nr:uncharacterized protein LOC118001113 isoform X1 [Mirounga leonina]